LAAKENVAVKITSCGLLCEDGGWVCETPHAAFGKARSPACGGAPCPMCNSSEDGETPRMPDEFKT